MVARRPSSSCLAVAATPSGGSSEKDHAALATYRESAQLGPRDGSQLSLAAWGGRLTGAMQQRQSPAADYRLTDKRCGVQRATWSQLGSEVTDYPGGVIEEVNQAVAGHRREQARLEREIEEVGLDERSPGQPMATEALGSPGEHPTERSTRMRGRLVDRYAPAVNIALPHPTSSSGPSEWATAVAAKSA